MLGTWWTKGYNPPVVAAPGLCAVRPLEGRVSCPWKRLEEPCPPRALARPSHNPEPFLGAANCCALRREGGTDAGLAVGPLS